MNSPSPVIEKQGLLREKKTQPQREHQKETTNRQTNKQKNNGFNEQNNNFARASHFSVHFFAVFALLRRENG